MPPKKKNMEEQKKKIVEDKTFGLKNKNKSKKVQQYVNSVKQQADRTVEQRYLGNKKPTQQQSAQDRKAMLEARMAELNMICKPVEEKKKGPTPAELEAKRREEEEAERLRILALPVEDQIEIERAKLKTKTPVTLESFMKWKEQKRKQREAEEQKKRDQRMKNINKADRAKGSGLTGKELFLSHKEAFVDDEGADDEVYEVKAGYSDEEMANQEFDPEAENNDQLEEGAQGGQSVDVDYSLYGGEDVQADEENEGEKDTTTATDVGDESLFS